MCGSSKTWSNAPWCFPRRTALMWTCCRKPFAAKRSFGACGCNFRNFSPRFPASPAPAPRADKAFVPVNTGSIPVDLLESQLFGHVKGAFTSAVASKKGLFEVADQGTIFFDEIATISPETQAKLLRVIQEREFMRLGGTEQIKVDVRIVAASNVELLTLVREGRFREDLFHRLNVIHLRIPPLRERREDVPLL